MRPARCAAVLLPALSVLLTPFASAAPVEPEPMLAYRVKRGDTLIALSQKVFVDARAWREIARLNRLPDPNRIRPDQTLRVPVRLMRASALPAALASTVGEVRANDAPVQAGDTLAEGQRLETAANASAVLTLADGSRVRMPPSSLAEIVASRAYGVAPSDAALAASNGAFAGALRMLRGSLEVLASKVRRAAPLEVSTPTAVIGVRGTHYRVTLDEQDGTTHSEVLDGRVRVETASRQDGTELAAGFGAAVGARSARPNATPLLAAPDLAAMPERFERPLVRFALPSERDTVRVQVAADPGFEKVFDDVRVMAGSDVRLAGLEDGRWHLRARRIDAAGIEGYDAARAFELKARPEPPASTTPRAGGKQSVGPVEFGWAPNVAAASARLQVARDAAFTDLVVERDDLGGNRTRVDLDTAGSYHWRLASTRADGDRGPFGDPLRFELRALPEPPRGGLAEDGKAIVLSWGGRPEDTQHVELARDPDFREIVAQDDLAGPQWTVPRPSRSGSYFFRYRSIEADGYVGPYSATLLIDVPTDWRWLWLFAPLILAL